MRSKGEEIQQRLIDFGARTTRVAKMLPRTDEGRYISQQQLMRSGLAPAPNYAEARAAESRADFIHKLGVVQKELNETSVWLRILMRINLGKEDLLVAIYQENVELARIITKSIMTARKRSEAPK